LMKIVDLSESFNEGDWSVFRMRPNSVTGRWPGDVQGYMRVAPIQVPIGETVYLAGYGLSKKTPELNYVQKVDYGPVIAYQFPDQEPELSAPKRIFYTVSTSGGNSGSPIVLTKTHEIIGVHTNGGCAFGDYNWGALIAYDGRFREAIRNCLAEEALELGPGAE
ncbi:MAG TPA: hypothetical protein VFV50_16575, partial [Bdellovibrionales bacterium]|nr:hypothetical protein [Bdellovibrionales bacterium]